MACIIKAIADGDDAIGSTAVRTSGVLANLTTIEQSHGCEILRRKKYPAKCQRIDLVEKDAGHTLARRSAAANAAITAEGVTQ